MAAVSADKEGVITDYLFVISEGRKRIVPIDMGAGEFSPAYVLRILRQFGFNDEEIEDMLK
jgi:hypothetical protein